MEVRWERDVSGVAGGWWRWVRGVEEGKGEEEGEGVAPVLLSVDLGVRDGGWRGTVERILVTGVRGVEIV